MKTMKRRVVCNRNIYQLIHANPAFSYLEGRRPERSLCSRWKDDHRVFWSLDLVVMGKTGYGKSSTLNRLIGDALFATSAVEACTREMHTAQYWFMSHLAPCCFSVTDLPGIGEHPDLEDRYLQLYRKVARHAQVVLYILRADQRDFSVDLEAFRTLFGDARLRRKVVIGLNCADKVEPLNRSWPFVPSAAQLTHIRRKTAVVAAAFGVDQADVVPYSAAEGYGFSQLMAALGEKVRNFLVPRLCTGDMRRRTVTQAVSQGGS